ncbi:MAG: topoisomerase [Verrucomicrobia bacterium]|nr:topoisomerase [Verrucomicrobiota bacterium]
MPRIPLWFFRAWSLALVLIALSVTARGQIPPGATKAEVINLLGWPVSSSGNTTREILNYEECSVLLEHGRLVKLEFKSPDSRQILFKKLGQFDGSVAPEAAAIPKPVPEIPPSAAAVPGTVPPKPAAAAPAPRQPPPPSPPPRQAWGLLKTSALVAAILVVVGIMAYKKWATEKKDFVKLQRELLKKGNTQSEAPYKPVPRDPSIVPRSADPFAAGVTLGLLQEMEWHRFELLVAAFERELGCDARLTDFGHDDGVDLRVYDKDPGHVTRLIECKAHGQQVKPDLVRALLDVMAQEKVPLATFYAPDGFSAEAIAVASGHRLELIDGPKLISRIKLLDSRAQARLYAVATEGDYKTPTCARCGEKMRLAEENTGNAHWACTNFPRCQNTIKPSRSWA